MQRSIDDRYAERQPAMLRRWPVMAPGKAPDRIAQGMQVLQLCRSVHRRSICSRYVLIDSRSRFMSQAFCQEECLCPHRRAKSELHRTILLQKPLPTISIDAIETVANIRLFRAAGTLSRWRFPCAQTREPAYSFKRLNATVKKFIILLARAAGWSRRVGMKRRQIFQPASLASDRSSAPILLI